MAVQTKKSERSVIAKNLRDARIAAGFESVSDAARFIGIPVPTAVAHEGKGTSFRRPKLEQLRKYAQAYATTIDALEGGIISDAGPAARVPSRDIPTADNLIAAPILGTAQAGNWIEDDPIQAEAGSRIFAKPNADTVFGIRVLGDSMNRVIQDGDVAVVRPWKAMKRDVRNNEVVVVQRERGGRYELTIKTFRDNQLWPESTNPKWRHPVPLKDGDVVTIVGLVVGLYRPL